MNSPREIPDKAAGSSFQHLHPRGDFRKKKGKKEKKIHRSLNGTDVHARSGIELLLVLAAMVNEVVGEKRQEDRAS